MDQEVRPSMVLMVPLPVSMADPKQGDEKYEENNTASQFGHVPQTEGPSPGRRWTRTIALLLRAAIAAASSVSHPSVQLPAHLAGSLRAPQSPPALRDAFRHVSMCWTSCILAGRTRLVPEPAPELTPCKAGEPGLGTGTRLSLASKTRSSPWFLLVSSGFYVLCKVLMVNIDQRCHPETWNLLEGKKIYNY